MSDRSDIPEAEHQLGGGLYPYGTGRHLIGCFNLTFSVNFVWFITTGPLANHQRCPPLAHHEMGQIGESECVHLFVRMLDTYACLVTRGVAEAPWPGILPDAINRKLKTSEPMRVLFNTLIKVSPIWWQRVL